MHFQFYECKKEMSIKELRREVVQVTIVPFRKKKLKAETFYRTDYES